MTTRYRTFGPLLLCTAAWLSFAAPVLGMLIPPVLDDRSYSDLVEATASRIPAHTPEWTNFNDSDPGVSLLELFDLLGTTGINSLLDEFQLVPPWDTLPRHSEQYWQEFGYVTMEAGLVLIAPNHVIGSDWPTTYWPQTHEQVLFEQYEKFRAYALAPEPLSLPLWLAGGLPLLIARRGQTHTL